MDQPKARQLETLLRTVEEIRRTERLLKDLKQRTTSEAHALAEIPDANLRLRCAEYAYWCAPEVNASDLSFGAIGQTHPSKLIKLLGSQTSNITCDRCGQAIEVESRSALAKVQGERYGFAEGYRVVCLECREAIFAARTVESDREDRAIARRTARLQALPYGAYIETKEWQRRLEAFLDHFLREHFDFACETCENAERLGVFHTSLEGLGRYDHLVMLCNKCIAALRAAGRVVGEPGPGNQVPPIVLAAARAEYERERGG